MSISVQPNIFNAVKRKTKHWLEKGIRISCHVLFNAVSLAMRKEQILQQLESDCYKAQEQNIHILRAQHVWSFMW